MTEIVITIVIIVVPTLGPFYRIIGLPPKTEAHLSFDWWGTDTLSSVALALKVHDAIPRDPFGLRLSMLLFSAPLSVGLPNGREGTSSGRRGFGPLRVNHSFAFVMQLKLIR
jgi:hypothetical protein